MPLMQRATSLLLTSALGLIIGRGLPCLGGDSTAD